MTMLYHEFQGLELSALGMGAMRLPVIDGDDARVDENAVKEMVAYAIEHGVNYFDTAWGYHNGQSELALGRALAAYPRDSFYLADKFPGYDLSNMDKVEEIFEAQLKKCGVDYFDFYLFHNVCELNIDAYLDRSHRIYAYLTEQKKNGRIRHLGFSAHGSCGSDPPLPRRLRRCHGVCPDSAQLSGLGFPGREGKGGAAHRTRPARVGDGAAARRLACKNSPPRRRKSCAPCAPTRAWHPGPSASCSPFRRSR